MKLRFPRLAAALSLLCASGIAQTNLTSASISQLIEANHWKRARAAVFVRLRTAPNDAEANYQLSKIDENTNDLEGAALAADTAVKVDPSKAAYHAQAAEVSALLAEKATLLKQVAHIHKMHKELEAAFTIDPKNIDALLVQAGFEWKAPAVVGGGRQKALETISALKAVSPLWGNLMEARLFQDEDLPRTQVALESAVKAAPQFYRARAGLADFYAVKLNRPVDAERQALELTRSDPKRAAAWITLAKIYGSEARYNELEATLSAAETNVPDDLGADYFAAKALLDRDGDAKRAEQYLRRYLSVPPEAQEPGPAEARQLLALAAARQGTKAMSQLQLPEWPH